MQEVDASAGVLFPFYDDDLGIVYLAGKVSALFDLSLVAFYTLISRALQGDGNIRFYEILENAPYVQYLSEFQSRYPQRGLGVMPKRGINPTVCEIFRFYKMHTTQSLVEPISFIVPRKVRSLFTV